MPFLPMGMAALEGATDPEQATGFAEPRLLVRLTLKHDGVFVRNARGATGTRQPTLSPHAADEYIVYSRVHGNVILERLAALDNLTSFATMLLPEQPDPA